MAPVGGSSLLARLRPPVVAALLAPLLTLTPADACTSCLRVFADGRVVVGRSMDWVEDPGSEIWVFPGA
jgi:penicillin V acylase-like amidase (Ntn superfamily)